MEYYEKIKIGGKTYVQRNEFSNFKILEDDGELKSIKDFEGYNNEIERIIRETLILKYNIDEYFITKINYNGDIVLTGFKNVDYLKNIVIPETINGKKVVYMTDIFRDANVKRVFLPDTMTTLCVSCFDGNPYIEEVYLSSLLKEVPAQCFKGCENLKRVNFTNLDTIGPEAFMLCPSIKDANLKNVKKVCRAAFYKCKNLRTVFAPNLIALSSDVFKGCTNLKSAQLSDDIEVINSSAFSGCLNLCRINTPEKLKLIKEQAFENCQALHKFNLKNVEVIQSDAFRFSGLEGIMIFPDSVKKIETEAFHQCKFSSISLGPNTSYATNAFGLYNIDKINIRKEKEIEERIEER